MKIQNIIAALSLTICLSPILHAENEREKAKAPQTNHAAQPIEKGFGELTKAVDAVRRQAIQAVRERDEALRALKTAEARNAVMAQRLEAMAKGRQHQDASDRRPEPRPQRDAPGEMGKRHEDARVPGDAAQIRKKFEELNTQKMRAESQLAESRKANEKLSRELKATSDAARRLEAANKELKEQEPAPKKIRPEKKQKKERKKNV